MMRFFFLSLWLIASASLYAGQYYVCTDTNGHKSFQEKSCPTHSKSELKKFDSSIPTNSATVPDNRLTTEDPTYQKLKANNRRLELSRDIRKSEQRLTQLEQDHTQALVALTAQKKQADNNLVGATLEQSIDTEMQMANERYNSLVANERQTLTKLEAELRALQKH